ncbi:pilus assembly PilX N-terminal domain-containing protein [Pseudomonas tohonis]|nr:pilus assembly PilX N-terminal domain-containing protein [Pseudomonas tohonis]
MNNKQNGMALLISLVLLLLLTVIAITAANMSSLQTRMAANSQQQTTAFQAAETGIRQWIATYEATPSPALNSISTSGTLTSGTSATLISTVSFAASAGIPGNCWSVIPSYSMDASENNTTFQYACYNIESTGKSCPDSGCADANNPARAKHLQGHLVRY